MKVSELFASVQGEGPSLGRPAIFLRLAQCNLRCLWCDTKYAWSEGFEKSIEEVVYEIMNYLKTYGKVGLLVVTGGEPLLQKTELIELITRLKREVEDLEVEVETNCTFDPGGVLEVADRLIVSPKLSNSGMREDVRRCSESFKHLPSSIKSKIYFKFVIESPGDIEEIEKVLEFIEVSPSSVFLMPQASTMEELANKMRMVVDLAVKTGFRVSDRLQIVGSFR